jgi:hypothetical protein
MGNENPEEHDKRGEHNERAFVNSTAELQSSTQQSNDEGAKSSEIFDSTTSSPLSSPPHSLPLPDPSHDLEEIKSQAVRELDQNWERSTWMHRSNKSNLRELLEQAGEDVTGFNDDTTKNEIITLILKRRERREADGLVKARTQRRAPLNAAGRPAKGLAKGGESGKASEDTEVRRIDKETANAYLSAIQEQYYRDLERTNEIEPTNFKTSDPGSALFRRATQLQHRDGDLVFSAEVQNLVRQLIRLRDTIDPTTSDAILQKDESAWIQARRDHTNVSRELSNALGTFIQKEDIDGSEVARDLVGQVFGLVVYNASL